MPRTILILSSTPRDMARLRVHEEAREIEDAIRRARDRDQYQVIVRLGIRARDVHRMLLEHRPAFVHFSGHGHGEQGIVLEDDDGDSLPVSGADLARMLGHFRHEIECVLINSCQAEAQIDDIAEHIPFVIGMKPALDDRAAISFAMAFYESLANGRSIPSAYDVASSAVPLNGLAIDRVAVLAGKGDDVDSKPRGITLPQVAVVAALESNLYADAPGGVLQWTNGHEQKALVSAGDSVQPEAETGLSEPADHTALLTAAVHTLYERLLPSHASEEHTAAVVRHLSESTGESALHRAMGLTIGSNDVEICIRDIALRFIRPKLFAQALFYMSKSKLLSLAQTTHQALFEPLRLAGRVASAVERLVRIHESYLSKGKLHLVVWPPPSNALQAGDLCFIVASIVMNEARSKAEFLVTPHNQVLHAATLDEPHLSLMLSRKHVLVDSTNHEALSDMVAGRPRHVLTLGYAEQLSTTLFRLSPLAVGLLHFDLNAME